MEEEILVDYEIQREKNIADRKREFLDRKLNKNPLLVSREGDSTLPKEKKTRKVLSKSPTRYPPKRGLSTKNDTKSPAVEFY